jgi:LysM repeat protein
MIDRVQTKGRTIASVFMILSLILLAASADLKAQPSTHTVQKGDTLWSICEKYYGDAFVWPKLWEMNPFVTNPHLLKPGDVITLIKKEDILKKIPPKEAAKPVPKMKGIDLRIITAPFTMGYLSFHKVEPWGEIYGSTKSELVAQKGDKIFLNINRADVKPGDAFRVAVAIPAWHPLTRRLPLDPPMGFVISIRGVVIVREVLQQGYCVAEVTDVFSDFGVGALILPFEPMSTCIQPLATNPKLYGTIVATKDNMAIIAKNSVVYMDSGFKDGIQQGQVFDIIRVSKIPRENPKTGTLEELANEPFSSAVSKEAYLADLWAKLTQGETTLYEYPVGKLIVVESRPDSSTAIVLSSTEELTTGALIKGFSWSDTPEFLMNLPYCAME